MRFLILGGDGMLGHQLYRHLRTRHEVSVTLHRPFSAYEPYRLFKADEVHAGIELQQSDALMGVFARARPELVVNAAGVVKQRADAHDAILNITINALLPHRVAALCAASGARLVHISTDCVFSGLEGHYTEASTPDPRDSYGQSKLLGEVHARHCLTLRTSMIGPEISRKTGLLEWFLAQQGSIRGFRQAIFSGFTTLELSRIVERVAIHHPTAHGLYHVSAEPISKYDLLMMLHERLPGDVEIVPDDELRCDRSLDSSRFRAEFSYTPPAWEDMLDELARAIGGHRT